MNMIRYGSGLATPNSMYARPMTARRSTGSSTPAVAATMWSSERAEVAGAHLEDEAVLVGEVAVDRRRGRPDRVGHARIETAWAEPVSSSICSVAARISSRSCRPSPLGRRGRRPVAVAEGAVIGG